MKALNNFRKTVPMFAGFIDAGSIELIQVIELQDTFVIMTFDKLENYLITPVCKGQTDDEATLFESAETEAVTLKDFENAQVNEYFSGSYEDYANLRFFEYIS